MSTLTCPTISHSFPPETVEEPFIFSILGTLADGTHFTDSVSSANSTVSYSFKPGTFTVAVTKNGIQSIPSDPATFTAPTPVMLTVPDPAGKAVISG